VNTSFKGILLALLFVGLAAKVPVLQPTGLAAGDEGAKISSQPSTQPVPEEPLLQTIEPAKSTPESEQTKAPSVPDEPLLQNIEVPKSTPESGQTKSSSMPEELLSQYIEAIKNTPEYGQAKAYEVTQVQKALEQWGYKVQPMPAWPYWDRLANMGNQRAVVLPDGGKAYLGFERDKNRPSSLVLEVISDNAPPASYKVSPSQLGELAFEVVSSVWMPEPALDLVESFHVENWNLSDVFVKLCTMGKLDHSYRADLAKSVRVSMDLHNKTIAECLSAAAAAAGGKVVYLYNTGAQDKPRNGTEIIAFGGGGGSSVEPGEKLLAILKQRIEEALPLRPTVVMTLPEQAKTSESAPTQ
jgi:hypothetical protein